MTQDEIIRMAREAGALDKGFGASPLIEFTLEELERFAALVAAHEREKWEPAFNKHKPAPKIDNGNVYFEAGLYTPLEVQLAIDLLTEREACAKVCDKYAEESSNPMNFAENCAAAIRVRGEK